jgi:hypothetical protein
MITYVKDAEKDAPAKGGLLVRIKEGADTLVHYRPVLLDSPAGIPCGYFFRYLAGGAASPHGDKPDLSLLAGLLQAADLKKFLKETPVILGETYADAASLKADYKAFTLESRMQFPYTINLYAFSCIAAFIGNLKDIVRNLNYCAHLSESRGEIDSVIKTSKEIISYELWVKDWKDYSFQDCSLCDMIGAAMSPFTVSRQLFSRGPVSFAGNPFGSENDFIACLAAPWRHKFNSLRGIGEIINPEKNLLYARLLEGYEALQRSVVTYRGEEIIELFLYCFYAANAAAEHAARFSQELHDTAYFIYSSLKNNDCREAPAYVPGSVHDILRIYSPGGGTAGFSSEAANELTAAKNIALDKIDENYKRAWDQLQKAYIKIFKAGISKIVSKKNSLFFKKYYGRIPHLFKQYAGKAPVVENTMVADPGKILSGSAARYVGRLSKDSAALFDALLQLARKIASAGSVEDKLNAASRYCVKFRIDKEDPETVKKAVLQETRWRIASSILQDNEVYGFTAGGIMMNGRFPPANHIVTSLFVRNPHEKPYEQSVSEIFSSGESILMFARPENLVKFNNLYQASASAIISTFNPKAAGLIEKNLERASKKMAYRIIHPAAGGELNPREEAGPKEQKRISGLIDRSVVKSIDMAVAQKRRCLQCAGIAHDMIGRVTDLAKRCVAAMLDAEKQATDTGAGNRPAYNSGNRTGGNRALNRQLEANKRYVEDRNG